MRLGLALLLLIGAAACTSRSSSGVDGVSASKIRVGTWGPLTGPQAAWGDSLRAMKAYFRWVNTQGGIHGRELELYVKDDRYDPSRTPAVARTLVEQDQVFAVVGAIGTAPGRAAAPMLERAGVPFFTPASGAAWFTGPEGPQNVRSVYLPYREEGRIIGRFIAGQLGLRKVAVLYQDDAFGTEGRDGVRDGLEGTEAKLVQSAPVLPTDTDVSTALVAVLNAKPDALVLYLAPRQAVLVGRGLAGRGARPQLVTSFVLNDPGLIERAGSEVWEGTLTAVVSQLADDHDHPAVQQFRSILEDFEPSLRPGGFALSGFRFAQPFVEALERAGPNLTRASFLAAVDGLRDYRGGGPHWEGEGLGSPVDFSKGRLGVRSLRFARAENGAFRLIDVEWLTAD